MAGGTDSRVVWNHLSEELKVAEREYRIAGTPEQKLIAGDHLELVLDQIMACLIETLESTEEYVNAGGSHTLRARCAGSAPISRLDGNHLLKNSG